MNYRRGLFRLWVILTVLWIAGVAFVSGPAVHHEFRWAAASQATLQGMSDEELMVALARAQEAERRGERPGEPAPTPNPWGSLGRTGAVALLPPLALLALGAALGWAFSGFRHQT